MKYAERPALRHFTRHEYARLIGHGFLDEDDPIELLGGLLLVKEPQNSPHRTAVLLVAKAVERAFGEGWIVNLVDRVLEVHREPARPGPARRHWGYAAIETLDADATVTPLAAPAARVRVADLLP
jgi:hypothetical protein